MSKKPQYNFNIKKELPAIIYRFIEEKTSTGVSLFDFLHRKGISALLDSHEALNTKVGELHTAKISSGLIAIQKSVRIELFPDRFVFGRKGVLYLNQIQEIRERTTYRNDAYGKHEHQVLFDIYYSNNEVHSFVKSQGEHSIADGFYNYLLHFYPEIQLAHTSASKYYVAVIKLAYTNLGLNPMFAFDLAIRLLIQSKGSPRVWKLMALITTVFLEDEALPFVVKAAEVLPKDPDVWNCKGLLHEKLGDTDQTKAAYDEALSINPYHELARANVDRLVNKDGETNYEDIQSVYVQMLHRVDQFKKVVRPKALRITQKDISMVKEAIGEKESIEIASLVSKFEFPKEKIEEIGTKHLGFTLEDDKFVKDQDSIDHDTQMKIDQIEHLIGSKNELELSYVVAITRFPKEEVVEIIEKHLGFKIKDEKIYQ